MNTTQHYSVIDHFLHQLGIDTLHWDGSPLTLTFDENGTLNLDANQRGVILALTQKIDDYQLESIASKVLRAIHLDQRLPFPVQAGLKGDHYLALIIVLRDEDVDLSNVNQALSLLIHLHEHVNQ